MKKIIILMAAMLLSVGAFAQSENNGTPLKGDVNGDGTVDVADIATIIQIMASGGGTVTTGGYFYLGTTEPTAENYQTLPGVVTTYTSIDDAAGTSVSIAAGETLYMLCPAAWLAGKTVELADDSENKYNFSEETDATTISGYVIYKTQVWNASNDVVLKTAPNTTQYWYVGVTDPTTLTINQTNDPLDKWTAVTSTQSSVNVFQSDDDFVKHYYYMAFPAAWGFSKLYDMSGTILADTSDYTVTTGTISGISYTIFTSKIYDPTIIYTVK